LQHGKSIIPTPPAQFLFKFLNFLQGMANNVGLTFSVGDTIQRVTLSIEQDKYKW
jgi:hypothetical protein